MASTACNTPITPGTKNAQIFKKTIVIVNKQHIPVPKTPPSPQLVTVSGGGGTGNKHLNH